MRFERGQLVNFYSLFHFTFSDGLINLFLPVRMNVNGAGIEIIGRVLSLYFVGILLAPLLSINLIKHAEHI